VSKGERFIEPFGLQIVWLPIFGRVDAQIPNLPAIFEKNGIPIEYPLYPDEFAMGIWRRGRETAIAFC
jgi:hypothetical protein